VTAKRSPAIRKRVLIVDDNPGIRETLSIALSVHCQVLTAASIADALSTMRGNSIHLVVLDYCFTDGPGDQALRLIKQTWPPLPVIVITGYGSESVCAHLFRLGARDYFSKPYDINDLVWRVKELLALPKGRVRRNALSSLPSASPREKAAAVHPGIQRALLWIHTRYAEPVSMEAAAKEAALSPFHFCRLFKATVGIGFRDYLARLRIEKAKELLRDRQMSATDACYAAGFTEYSSFYEAFRRVTGQSPRTWRWTLMSNSSPATSPI